MSTLLQRIVLIPMAASLAVFGLAAGAAWAQPAVVPTAQGQIGEAPPTFFDQVLGNRFEHIRGQPGDVLLGGLLVSGGVMPPPPSMEFLTDQIHGTPSPVSVGSSSGLFNNVAKLLPASARARNAANDGDLVAFSFALDGTLPQTMTVRVATFDQDGNSVVEVPLENIDTAPVPDPSFATTGVAVDDQGRLTVVYTQLEMMGTTARVRGQRLNGQTGALIGGSIPITDAGHAGASVALLDPDGSRLIIPSSDFFAIRGNILDASGPTPVVGPEFPISTTPAQFANLNPVAAADPSSGAYTVVWENLSGQQGNPVDLFGRRFDADGNPVGNDFVVNTTTANAQGQQDVAYGPAGTSAVVWAGDAAPGDELDVFLQVYDAMGNPIGGEISVNTTTAEVQDHPSVRFLPEPDNQGRPQLVVAWRDVGVADGTQANGTGTSYRCFSIDGLEDPSAIFADGFESGDTSSWSVVQPGG